MERVREDGGVGIARNYMEKGRYHDSRRERWREEPVEKLKGEREDLVEKGIGRKEGGRGCRAIVFTS